MIHVSNDNFIKQEERLQTPHDITGEHCGERIAAFRADVLETKPALMSACQSYPTETRLQMIALHYVHSWAIKKSDNQTPYIRDMV